MTVIYAEKSGARIEPIYDGKNIIGFQVKEISTDKVLFRGSMLYEAERFLEDYSWRRK